MATTVNTTAAPPTTATAPIETNHDNNMDIDPIQAAAPVEQQTPKRKRKDKALEKEKEKPHILHQSTFRKPLWTYFHLSLTTPTTASRETNNDSKSATSPSNGISPPVLDALTASSLLTPPLTSYLGLTGSSIPIDILKTAGRDVWIRLPRQDARAFQASLSGWIGVCEADLIPGVGAVDGENGARVKVAWRVVKRAEYLGFLVGEGSGDGLELFEG